MKTSINGQLIDKKKLLTSITSTSFATDIFIKNSNPNSFWVSIDNSPTGGSSSKLIEFDKNLTSIDTITFLGIVTQRKNFKWLNSDYLLTGGFGSDMNEINSGASYINSLDLAFQKYHKDSTFTPFPNINNYINYTGKDDTSEVHAFQTSLDFVDKNNIYLGGTSNAYRQYSPYLEPLGFHNNDSYFFVNCYDSTGSKKWDLYVESNFHDYMMGLKATSDGGVLLYGSRYNYTQNINKRNVLIMKIKNNDFVNYTSKIVTNQLIKIYPNPSSSIITVELNNNMSANFIVYNLQGQVINHINKQENSSIIKIDISDYINGIYFIKVINSQGYSKMLKFIKK
jgi:hypothetical protein